MSGDDLFRGPRFFGGTVAGQQVMLDAAGAHHLLKVLRARPGDPFVVLSPGADGAMREFGALLAAQGAVGEIVGSRPAAGEPPVAVTLLQGLAKGDKMDLIIQKATELGVHAIVPVSTERAVVRLDGAKAAERVERWQRIAKEAAQQCRRALVPTVRPVLQWSAAADLASAFDLALVPWEAVAGGSGLRSALAGAPAARTIAVYIGPEGGLTAGEAQAAARGGARTVSLGPRILRTETAGLAALAAIMYAVGDLG